MFVNSPAPHPRPGPTIQASPDIDGLRAAFDDLLNDSAAHPGAIDDAGPRMSDDQVHALDAAHDLLARALTALDSTR